MKLGKEAQSLSTQFGVAVQPWKGRLSIGVGTSLNFGGTGKMEASGIVIDPSGTRQSPQHQMFVDLKTRMGILAGIQYLHPFKFIDMQSGFSFRQEQFLNLENFQADASTSLLEIQLPLSISIIDQYSPHTFTASTNFRFKKPGFFHHWATTIELEAQLWSGYKIDDSTALLAGSPAFKNILIPRIGFEIPFTLLSYSTIRSGYSYIPAFTPDQVSITNYLDNNKHAISLGFGIILPRNFLVRIPTTLDAGLQLQLWEKRNSSKEVSDQFNPDYSYKGHVIIFSLSASWRF